MYFLEFVKNENERYSNKIEGPGTVLTRGALGKILLRSFSIFRMKKKKKKK